ncbi:DctP family TRAP transporter solute-binding subunit [Pseudonocardia kunmingensis]|uniref:C4-dicarboxylate-binding protein DctP n=1 Tax=Pseudonocardia kunmingensis TaxID=630975 RepID=A0A543DVT3_9PSEU|nr:DctP family TRAP transporter solute-binding subunit [Pseudonocardia kunmingensis]TQM13446.1 C4-dicarboxylate-binding protein DctP [Pseudonocardia kunmingensis]
MIRRHGRRSKVAVLVVAAALVLAACGARGAGADAGGGADGGESFTIKFSHVVTPATPKGQAAERFKEVVEERSGGRVTVEIYPNSELYGDKDELQALQSNSVQMLAPASAKFTTVAPALQVLDLPFLFDSVEDIPEVASPDSAVGKAIYENEALAASNIKVMGLWDNGLKQLSSNTEMRTPASLAGLSFRIQPSDVLRSQFEKWGASSTPLAFAEVYNALQQGVVNGQENPYSNIESQNMHTVQSHITESNHGYIGYVLVINNQFFESLPPDLQEVVQSSADEASTYNREVAAKLNSDARTTIEQAGTTTILDLTPEERQAFKDAVVPSVWEQYADVIGPELIADLLADQAAQ